MSHKLDIALAKEACPLCGKAQDGPILINKRMVVGQGKVERELHGKIIGYMDKPCGDCEGMMAQGFLLIGVVESKTEDKSNPYRSGNQWVISNEAAERMFPDESLRKKGAAFIDVILADKMGFPGVNLQA